MTFLPKDKSLDKRQTHENQRPKNTQTWDTLLTIRGQRSPENSRSEFHVNLSSQIRSSNN